MNRKTTLTGFVALALVAVSSLQAAGSGFVRPLVGYISPDADGYDDAAYIGFAAGGFVGKTHNHEFSGEIGFTMWTADERLGSSRLETEEAYVPILASYRYYVQSSPEAKARFYFGPSVGFTEASYDVKITGPGLNRSDDSTEYLATFALNAGVDFRLNEKLSLNVGYRYLYIDGGSTELLNVNFDYEESKAHAIIAGLTIRF